MYVGGLLTIGNDLVSTIKRSVEIDAANVHFRLFIWKDMIEDLYKVKPLFGMSWGHPQRSISVEILDIAHGEWTRDGWITPHNAFLHYIYRGGIVGILIIIFIFFSFFNLAASFIFHKSIPGILLTSLLAYWMAIAAFSLFWEFPYQAISFWTMLGMLWGYKQQLQQKAIG